jgi:hypothetical protein
MLPAVINERVRLSVGLPTGQRIFAVLFGVVFAAVGAAFVLAPLVADGLLRRLTGNEHQCTISGDPTSIAPDALPPELRDCLAQGGAFGDAGIGLGPIRFIGLCGIPFVLLGLYLALRGLRTAVWLDGTRADVRGALRIRSVDLATAEIIAGAITYRRDEGGVHDRIERVPTLIARDPGTGRKVTIALHGGPLAILPPHELRALAAAMTANRPTDGRDGDVHTIARQLRTMADNPLGL